MAYRYINDILHEITKVHSGSCDQCGKGICVGWMVSHPANNTDRTTKYCYDCTKNSWLKALSIHKNMKHKETKLPIALELRKCPGCGFIKDQESIDSARLNFLCPRCGKHRLSDFMPDTPPKQTKL